MLLGKLEDNHQLIGCLKKASRFSKVEGVHNYSNSRPRQIKVGIRFSFDTLFIFDFDICAGIEENLVLNQKVV